MDFDYKKKHNLKFYQDLLRQSKSIRYNVVGAPKNPFEAAAGKSSKLSKTVVCTKASHTSLQDRQDDVKSNLSVIQSNSDSSTSQPVHAPITCPTLTRMPTYSQLAVNSP